MPVDQYIVERIIKTRKSKSPPIRQLKDIIKFNNDKINEGAIFRLSINDFTNICKKKTS
jgi:hypothetical protein